MKTVLIFVFVVLLVVVVIVKLVINEREETYRNSNICEARGGVYVKHTRKVGKHSNSTYLCFKRESLIEIDP